MIALLIPMSFTKLENRRCGSGLAVTEAFPCQPIKRSLAPWDFSHAVMLTLRKNPELPGLLRLFDHPTISFKPVFIPTIQFDCSTSARLLIKG